MSDPQKPASRVGLLRGVILVMSLLLMTMTPAVLIDFAVEVPRAGLCYYLWIALTVQGMLCLLQPSCKGTAIKTALLWPYYLIKNVWWGYFIKLNLLLIVVFFKHGLKNGGQEMLKKEAGYFTDWNKEFFATPEQIDHNHRIIIVGAFVMLVGALLVSVRSGIPASATAFGWIMTMF